VIGRLFKAVRRTLSAWFRRAGQTPRGTFHSGSHSAFGRTFSLIQLTAGRRPYLLYLPSGFRAGERLPMLVMMHGCKQDAETFAAATRMNGLADRDRFIVLYPEQRRLANPHRCWNWFSASAQSGAGEAMILSDMIRALVQEHGADASRVYIAGLSAGAAMANNLACCHGELFAACALHSGLMYEAGSSTHDALEAMRHGSRRDPAASGQRAFDNLRGKVRAMPALVIHGDGDAVVNPVNADQIVVQFATMNRLLAADPAGDGPRLRTREERSAGGFRYQIADHLRDGQPLLRQVLVRGLGHAWSGGSADYPYNDPRGPDASELICDFFAEHGLRDAAAPAPVARA
jgi:poly(hydroxyalkanoate) depolymerase family esterase